MPHTKLIERLLLGTRLHERRKDIDDSGVLVARAAYDRRSACFAGCVRFAVSFIWRSKSSDQSLNFEFYKVKQSFAKVRLKPLSREDTSSEFEARRFPPVPSPFLGTTKGLCPLESQIIYTGASGISIILLSS